MKINTNHTIKLSAAIITSLFIGGCASCYTVNNAEINANHSSYEINTEKTADTRIEPHDIFREATHTAEQPNNANIEELAKKQAEENNEPWDNMPENVFFNKNGSHLDDASVKGHGIFLNNFSNAVLTLTPYTDGYGSKKANMAVSFRRLERIKESLISLGASEHQVKYDLSQVTYGKTGKNNNSDNTRYVNFSY